MTQLKDNTNLSQGSLERTSGGLRACLSTALHPHFSPYKVYVNKRHRLVVILNPKVGTTTFRHLIKRASLEVFQQKDVSRGRYKLFPKARHFPFASVRDYLHAFTAPQEYDFYCFVRNPYSRLKSAWGDKFAFGEQWGYPHSIGGKILQTVRQFALQNTLPGNADKSTVPFSTFVQYIASQKTGHRNHHWDIQASVLMIDRIRYARIYKMETEFKDGMEEIFAQLEIPRGWTQDALAEPRNVSRKIKKAIYTEELAEQCQEIYKEDFEMFGYDQDSWHGM